jgi:hypothetical protein
LACLISKTVYKHIKKPSPGEEIALRKWGTGARSLKLITQSPTSSLFIILMYCDHPETTNPRNLVLGLNQIIYLRIIYLRSGRWDSNPRRSAWEADKNA